MAPGHLSCSYHSPPLSLSPPPPPRAAHSMPHTRAHDAARPTKAAVTSATSGTPLSSTTRSNHKAHSSTRPPPLPSTNMRGSAASSSAATSAATSTNSCASGGWRSSTGSTPPTSPGDSDASGCHDPPPSNHHQSYFAHEVTNVKEEPTERRRAQSERGPTSPDLPLNQKKNKLLKKRPATVSVSGAEMLGRGESKPRIESGPAPGPSRAKSILGIKIGSSREKTREREGRLASVAEWTEGVEYLPQVRTSSPLWAGSSGMLPSPYSRLAVPSSCILDSHLDDVNPTDALASLAFTGHSSALSSSALAALTSRLTHRASSEVLTASSHRGSSKKSKHGTHLDVPPWTAAFSVTPIERSAKNSIEEGMVAGTFDPYAEARRDVKKERSSLSLLHSLRERTSRESDTAIPGVEIRRASRRENSPNTLRRWTLAMADVPDDVLVQELEKLRMGGRGVADSASPARKRRKRSSKVGETSELGHDDDDWKMVGEESSSGYSGDELAPSPTPSASHLESHSGSSPNQLHSVAHLSSLDDHEWKTARRALLCCRELVRTERNYQARLRVLVSGETSTPPPAIVLTYIPALLHASEALLSRLEDDPSAWGVSAGFVAVEEEVESAFVAWAGVVGEIFVGSSEVDSRERVGRKLTRSSRNSSVSSVSDSANKMLSKRSRSGASIAHARMESVYRKRGISMYEAEPASPPPSRPVSAAVSTMGMFTAALGTGLAYGISPSAPSTQSQDELARPRITTTPNGSAGTLSRTFGAFKTKKNAFSPSPSHSPHVPASPVSPGFSFMSSAKEDEREKEKEKNPSVRELAILPVQRVMRYVLQYRDLLANTPVESPSRGLVERALESATRIAAKCDRAQDNSAFFLRRS
ncbi:hypothetical protein PHLGIDRAFT_129914 [Phlebiopsis gigantea 11061_1 CR5-6]|uniref:DH domain-containing protein n=1 Tax=Phlebiopsis gigantea (strain 11061_1 CR5-6) TaxID=745531 RepID=A0A0C3NGI8_PHLG1|nr:hypothetical protein PHLGIDRAFT_129914 [Phlebiopsis gigantea 11061_1 CR5-6]